MQGLGVYPQWAHESYYKDSISLLIPQGLRNRSGVWSLGLLWVSGALQGFGLAPAAELGPGSTPQRKPGRFRV